MASAIPAQNAQPNEPSARGPASAPNPLAHPQAPNPQAPNPQAPNPQGLDPALLDVLACPADHHAPLRLGSPADPDAPSLTCTECGRVFPIRDSIPVLLLDEATSRGPSLDSAAGR